MKENYIKRKIRSSVGHWIPYRERNDGNTGRAKCRGGGSEKSAFPLKKKMSNERLHKEKTPRGKAVKERFTGKDEPRRYV